MGGGGGGQTDVRLYVVNFLKMKIISHQTGQLKMALGKDNLTQQPRDPHPPSPPANPPKGSYN